MKKFIVIFLFCCSCSSTDKLLQTKTKQEVIAIEEKRFNKKQLPVRYDEWKIYVMTIILLASLIVKE